MNLSKDMGDPTSLNLQRMVVQGHIFQFSHNIINHYWECDDILEDKVGMTETDPMVFVIMGGKGRT